jgi:hypothetical protein
LFEQGAEMASLHAQAHGFVEASMLTGASVNDPVFFLLRSYVDVMWYEWQRAQRLRFPGTTFEDGYAFNTLFEEDGPMGHNLNDPMIELFGVAPAMVLSHGNLSYRYDVIAVQSSWRSQW